MRVLQIFGEPLSNGGQEAFIMNMYRNIDRNKVQFDFFTPYYCDNEKLKDEINELGGKVYVGNGKFDGEGNKKDFINGLKKIMSKHKYEVVHIHSGSIFALSFGAKVSKKYGAKKIIVHSHCTGNNNFKYKIMKIISAPIFLNNVTDYCACSKLAAEWKFPKSIVEEKKFKIIKNGIELEKFQFHNEIRDKYRKDLNIEKDFVICHIGRFTEQKNHEFLIQIFEKIKSKCNKSKLLLIGDGPNREHIKKMVEKMKINDSVIFLKIRRDVNNILQAADAFVFPSKFEGLGIVAIEAQATGLQTICSENIPEEANQTELFHKLNLSDDVDTWVNKVLELKEIHNREEYSNKLKIAGYDAKNSARSLERIYLEGI